MNNILGFILAVLGGICLILWMYDTIYPPLIPRLKGWFNAAAFASGLLLTGVGLYFI